MSDIRKSFIKTNCKRIATEEINKALILWEKCHKIISL